MSNKKTYEEGYTDGREISYVSSAIVGFFFGAALLTMIFLGSGIFDSAINKLDLDKDEIARYHILNYYPEYENCSIVYGMVKDENNYNVNGVKIYCNEKDNRDGMRIIKEKVPTVEIEFEEITLKDILNEILEDYSNSFKGDQA